MAESDASPKRSRTGKRRSKERASPTPARGAGVARVHLGERPRDVAKGSYQRGVRFPLAIAWFGARSFWGHLWHLAASVIATEDIDSRDWMRADAPEELTARIAGELHARKAAPSLTESLERDLWIDFVADTGDCASVSGAVARLIFERYEVDDPAREGERLLLPRGDVLLFGGDTAYPVATDLEIHNRVDRPVEPRAPHGARRQGARAPRHPGQSRLVRGARRLRANVPSQARANRSRVDRGGR